jgi:hypothetical protein
MNRLPHAIASAALSASSAAYAWFAQHGNAIATGLAVVAALFSIWASVDTVMARRRRERNENP